VTRDHGFDTEGEFATCGHAPVGLTSEPQVMPGECSRASYQAVVRGSVIGRRCGSRGSVVSYENADAWPVTGRNAQQLVAKR